MSYLSDQLREHGPAFGLTHLCDEAADALDANDARMAALEAKCALLAASLAQSEREVEERDARIAGKVDGWKLVPIEPTMDMVVDGFESWPSEGFSSPEEWAAYQAMSGCQQAAHKARLCYAAMLAAAPTDTVSPAVDAQPVAFEAWAAQYGFHAELIDVHQYAKEAARDAWQAGYAAALAQHTGENP